MTDVYLSFVPADRETAANLAAAFERREWAVFWDLAALPDDEADDAAEAALAEAACVVAIWSAESLGSGSWVGAESAAAARRSALVGVLAEPVRPPRKLRRAPTVDLGGWDGRDVDPEFLRLVGEIERLITAAPAGPRVLKAREVRPDAPRVPDDLLDGKLGELRGHTGEVYDLAWAPGGLLVATASADGTARIWDAIHREEKVRIKGHDAEVNDVAFSPDGRIIATASDDGTARTWDAGTGAAGLVYRGHGETVFWVGISPSGDVAASAGSDGKVHVWRLGDGKEVWTFNLDEEVSTARFLDGTVLVTADDDGDLVLWDLEAGESIAELDIHDGQIADIAVAPTGTLVASGSDRGAMAVYNLPDGSLRWWGSDMAGQVYGLAFTPDGRKLAATDDEGVTLFRTDDGEVIDGRADPDATRLEFSPTRPTLAIASGNAVKLVTAPAAGR